MRPQTLTSDEARILPRFRASAELRHEQRRVLQREVATAHAQGREIKLPVKPTVAGGDPVALRGIPAVGVRGVGGAIRGTSPHQAIDRLPDGPLVAFA